MSSLTRWMRWRMGLGSNVLAHHLCMRRLKLLARAAYRVIGPCNNPDCLACRTLGSL